MVQRQQRGGSAAASNAGSATAVRPHRWFRIAVMFLSFGMIYPNAMVEDMDVAKYDADSNAKTSKK